VTVRATIRDKSGSLLLRRLMGGHIPTPESPITWSAIRD